MAYTASSLSQISLSGNEITISGTIVLLKDESLTKASDSSAINYSNYGNYKAIKVTDSNSATQYIVSMIGHNNVYDSVRVDNSGSNSVSVAYPTYQHPFELSYLDKPLADYPDGTENLEQIFDAGLGGSQTRDQRFDHSYESTTSDNSITKTGRYDLIKGAMVGDTVTVKFIKGDTVDVTTTGYSGTIQSGLLEALNSSKNIYNYFIHELTFTGSSTSDKRVDVSTTTFLSSVPMSATRPGINFLNSGTVSATGGGKVLEFDLDIQGLATIASPSLSELGASTSNGLSSNGASFLLIEYIDSTGEGFEEDLLFDSYVPGYDLCGRFKGKYTSSITFNYNQFPIKAHIKVLTAHSSEINIDHWQGWSRLTEEERSDSIFPKLAPWLVNDPFCFDRSYTTSCSISGDDQNPWFSFVSLVEHSLGSLTSSNKNAVQQNTINSAIQWSGSIIKEANVYELTPDEGVMQRYEYQTKKYYVSTKDRPSMIRTISLTYHSDSDILFKVSTDSDVKYISFKSTATQNEEVTVTKVLGMSAKYFDITIVTLQHHPQSFLIRSVQLQYG
jgi:hypothetical protein